MAAVELKKALEEAGGDLNALEGRSFFAEFFDIAHGFGLFFFGKFVEFRQHVQIIFGDGEVVFFLLFFLFRKMFLRYKFRLCNGLYFYDNIF